jgi:ABC-type sugar transport system ATPase subunit
MDEACPPSGGGIPALRLRGIVKEFAGIRVLHGVDLDVTAGQVHALLGENGAGKSTLMKVAAGVLAPDGGGMSVAGVPHRPRGPADARRAGVAMAHQELSLAPDVSIAENIFAGNEPCRGFLVDWKELYRRAGQWLSEFGLDLDPAAAVATLGPGYRQIVEILKALASGPRVVIFDEPTSSLEAHESAAVLRTIRQLAARSIGVVYVSHRLDEVFAVADHITVLRDGRLVLEGPAAGLDRKGVVHAMVGRQPALSHAAAGGPSGEELLRVEDLARGPRVRGVSFHLGRGEVLGFSGLMGSGRTELMRAIFGAPPVDSGAIFVGGRRRVIRSVGDAIAAGIAYVPEERKTEGLFLDRSVEDNIASANLRRCSAFGLVRPARTRRLAAESCRDLAVKLTDPAQEAGTLSGGNQQKILLARWLATGPRVLIVDEPTRGVDVGAKGEIHRMLRDYANAGNGVIVVSSEMLELLGFCDRILVMREGRIAGEVPGASATEQDLITLAVG